MEVAPLIKYIKEGDLKKIEERIKEHPEEINMKLRVRKDKYKTALKYAFCRTIVQNRLEILELLLKNGANPNIHYKNGDTLLHYSIYTAGTDVVELLLKYGADPYICNADRLNCFRYFNHYADKDKRIILNKYWINNVRRK